MAAALPGLSDLRARDKSTQRHAALVTLLGFVLVCAGLACARAAPGVNDAFASGPGSEILHIPNALRSYLALPDGVAGLRSAIWSEQQGQAQAALFIMRFGLVWAVMVGLIRRIPLSAAAAAAIFLASLLVPAAPPAAWAVSANRLAGPEGVTSGLKEPPSGAVVVRPLSPSADLPRFSDIAAKRAADEAGQPSPTPQNEAVAPRQEAVTVLDPARLPVSLRADAAYVLAQQAYLAGDPALVARRLALMRSDFAADSWVARDRIPIMVRYARAAGSSAPDFADPSLTTSDGLVRYGGRVLLGLAAVVLVAGLAWGWISNRIGLRLRRIEGKIGAIDSQRRGRDNAEASTAAPRDAPIDARIDALSARSARLKRMTPFAVPAAVFLLATALLTSLPPAFGPVVFESVHVPQAMESVVRDVGLSPVNSEPRILGVPYASAEAVASVVQLVLAVAAIPLLALRWGRRWFWTAVLTVVLLMGGKSVVEKRWPHATLTVAQASSFSLSPDRQRGLTAEQRMGLAYQTAQIAYIRDQPAEVANQLRKLTGPATPKTHPVTWRIQVMTSWCIARGLDVPVRTGIPWSVFRATTLVAAELLAALIIFWIGSLALSGVIDRRLARIAAHRRDLLRPAEVVR